MEAQQQRANRFEELAEKKEAERNPKKGVVNLAEALKHVQSGGAVKDLIRVPVLPPTSRAAKHTSESPGRADYSEVMPIPVPLPGTHWVKVSQVVSGRPKEAVIKALFVGKPNFRPVEGILRDPLDPHYVKGGGKENICTIVHTNRLVRQSNDVFGRIAQLNETDFTPSELNEVRKWCQEASYYCVSNGPLMSCFKRYSAAAAVAKPAGRYYLQPEVLEAVCAMLPWNENYVRDMKGKMPGDLTWVVLNVNSSSGFPWDQPKREVLLPAYNVAAEIINASREGTIEALIRAHPQWMLVKLMNKLDRYDTRELLADLLKGVVRQYFVYGFHWVILFSCLNQNIAKAMKGFWEDPNCFSAHGFAWQDGGPQRIIDWVRWASKQKPGLYGIAYSDDQLWVVVCEDGTWYILVPDFNRMDLNLVSAVGRLYYMYGLRVLADKVDKTWDAMFRLQCKMSFTCPVLMEAAVVLETDNHLHSGAVGTPEFDQVASAACFHLVKTKVGAPKDRMDALQRLKDALAAMTVATGLTMKPWELYDGKEIDADPERNYVTPWLFLGKHLCYVADAKGWVPRSDPIRCIASLIAPKARQDGASGFKGQLQRVRQIIAAGGFAIPQVFWGATQWYRTCHERLGLSPADPFEPADQNLIDHTLDLELALTFPNDEMPTFEECCNIYLPEGRKYDTRTAVPTVAGVGQQPGVVTASGMVSDMFGDKLPETGAWADSVEAYAPIATPGMDKGASNIQPLPPTTPERLGRARPKTAEEAADAAKRRKQRWLDRTGRLYEDIRRGLKSGITSTARPLKGALSTKLGRALDALIVAVDDHIDEPDYAPGQSLPYEDAQDELEAMDEFAEESYYAALNDQIESRVVARNKTRQW